MYSCWGEGRVELHSCDTWRELVLWFDQYERSEDGGGWKWFELRRGDEVRARYA